MLDHVGFTVRDFERSRAFYRKALAAIGITELIALTAEQTGSGAHAGFGSEGKPYFWIGEAGAPLGGSLHVAFRVGSREAVDAFHAAALAAGGRDNGAPGLRTIYHPNYYGAFVFDPDGHNVEAVCHAPVA